MSLGLSTVSAATPSSERIASGERARNVRPPGTWWKQKLAPIGEWMNASAGLAFTRHVHIGVEEDIAAKMCTTNTEMFMHHVRVVLRYCGCPVRTCSLKVVGPAFGQVASASLCSPDGHMIGGAIGGSLIAANPVQKDVVSTSPLTCSSLVARCCRPPPQPRPTATASSIDAELHLVVGVYKL